MTDRLADRHALITGGGSGVGAVIARTLADAGASVTILGRRIDALQDVARSSDRIHPVVADVTDESALAGAFAEATAARGAPSIVVANAGAAQSTPLHRMEMADWQAMLAVNLTGVFGTFRVALPSMRAAVHGRLIAIASTAGLKGYPYVAHYCAAKHGVVGLVRALALETARTGITVNAICPGFTETPLLERSIDNIIEKTGKSRPEAEAALTANNPQGRLIQPSEIADTVLWLCGTGAASVTGQAISISGGET
ncbi:SDR family NAD(P)-dependent oxidoreductase [Pararhizobium haloflavum]|uniref:SDR family NAD(P)-dependent oxidoreductase n=1 Tax=Pararhizobium haloflavum TaxID=2037914 RepID=UPI000C19BECC|nr:SDR family NAD(P)-dependent oxidoreductase [Pararhizobium haloflavum]